MGGKGAGVTQGLTLAAITGEIVDSDAVEIGALIEKARACIVDSALYQIECGDRLARKKASLPHGAWLPWLAHNKAVLGFESRQTAHKLMQLAARQQNVALTRHLEPAEALAISRQTWGNSGIIATKHTGDPESYTPAKYIEAARAVMGSIDVDPASNPLAQETVQAGEWFDEGTNGLAQRWRGTVFLNPPYTYPLVADFIDKLCGAYKSGDVQAAVLLTNNNTDTRWWHMAATVASSICLTAGRINFYKADGSETQPTNGQSFFYFGPDASAFAREFAAFGLIVSATGEC
jgi:ParB family chromosome partitioning protein